MRLLIIFGAVALCCGLRVIDEPGATMEKEFMTDSGPVTLIVGKRNGRNIKIEVQEPVPPPFEIKSTFMMINSAEDEEDEPESFRSGRLMQTMMIDQEGVPVIEGVREPDDPRDTRIFRNARVINNVLVTSEDDLANAVDSGDDNEPLYLGRQARILTGPVVFQEEKGAVVELEPLPPNNPGLVPQHVQSFPAYYYKTFYDPDRSGKLEPEKSKNEQQVVSYSYATSGGALQKTPTRNVVYGSGVAAFPPGPGQRSPVPVPVNQPQYKSPSVPGNFKAPVPQSFQAPSQFWQGFNPSNSPFGSQQATRKSISEGFSQSNVQFPQPGSTFVGSSSTFAANPVSNSIASANHATRQQASPPPPPSWAAFQQQKQQQQAVNSPPPQFQQQFNTQHKFQQPAVNSPHQFQQQQHRFSQGSQNSHFKVHNGGQQQHQSFQQHHPQGLPTPHQAFGEAASNIHPGLIPTNSDNFVIEKATFQSHPGAPAFTVPIPKPISQTQPQFFGQPHPNQFSHPYYQEAENRPFIERMMDPFRRVGDRVRDTMFTVNERFGNRFRIPERMDKLASGTFDADSVPLVAGAAAIASLGAIGAYAASKYPLNLNNLTTLLSQASGKRSAKVTVPDILLQLANDLEKEEPSFMKKFVSTTSWLESPCAKRVFCTLVTSSLKEEEMKLEEEAKEMAEKFGEELANSRTRQGRAFLATDMILLEKQMALLIDNIPAEGPRKELLKRSADQVLESVRERKCLRFSCNNKNDLPKTTSN